MTLQYGTQYLVQPRNIARCVTPLLVPALEVKVRSQLPNLIELCRASFKGFVMSNCFCKRLMSNDRLGFTSHSHYHVSHV